MRVKKFVVAALAGAALTVPAAGVANAQEVPREAGQSIGACSWASVEITGEGENYSIAQANLTANTLDFYSQHVGQNPFVEENTPPQYVYDSKGQLVYVKLTRTGWFRWCPAQ
ncbi:hypothetical protein ABZV60_32870 [Streptomyces sp. NPDC004787]|uniref:hypothetical protein n=1 Tax=Streptomyces sp. NPDC004787 TaxID=3154291 RepID=UPI0033B64E97